VLWSAPTCRRFFAGRLVGEQGRVQRPTSRIEDNTFDGVTTIADGTLGLEGSHVVLGGFTVTDVTVPGPLIIGGNSLSQQSAPVLPLPPAIDRGSNPQAGGGRMSAPGCRVFGLCGIEALKR